MRPKIAFFHVFTGIMSFLYPLIVLWVPPITASSTVCLILSGHFWAEKNVFMKKNNVKNEFFHRNNFFWVVFKETNLNPSRK
jgi:hypothetical protein